VTVIGDHVYSERSVCAGRETRVHHLTVDAIVSSISSASVLDNVEEASLGLIAMKQATAWPLDALGGNRRAALMEAIGKAEAFVREKVGDGRRPGHIVRYEDQRGNSPIYSLMVASVNLSSAIACAAILADPKGKCDEEVSVGGQLEPV
jgi:hypothetical protein